MENQQTSTQTGQKSNGGDFQSQPLQTRGQQGEHAQEHTEGVVARTIEEQTAKLPSDTFLWAAVGAIGVSAALQFTGHDSKSRFVGQWVAPFLLLGVYNKLVKVAGSDRLHH
jgi:hypothetical protein